MSRLPGFPQSVDDHVFVLAGPNVSYECACRFLDIFEGETYLAWSERCTVHQPRPSGHLDEAAAPSIDDLLTERMKKGSK